MFVIENPESSGECAGIICLVIFIILIVIIISFGCWKYCNHEQFKSTEKITKLLEEGILYNPLYTSPNIKSPGSFIYTQPMGDTNASKYAKAGEGTSGEFLPLQGRASGVFMKNSSNENIALPSKDIGNIGGFPNYTDQIQTSRMTAGFNDFGAPFQNEKGAQLTDKDYTNSYLLDGANRRVCNSGQKCNNLSAQNWWPTIKKGSHGFALQASDAMVPCNADPKNVEGCEGQGSKRFLKSKYEPRWMSVFQNK